MTLMTLPLPARSVIDFWLDAGPQKWFAKDLAFDAAFRQRFMDDHMAAASRELDSWMDCAEGALALILLLDQFPRNAFRDTAHMFATDSLALRFAQQGLERGYLPAIDKDLRVFMILPFEHSEDLHHQELAVQLCQDLDQRTLQFAILHRDIIMKFGRFPHRNEMLGRVTTDAEREFLYQGGFKG